MRVPWFMKVHLRLLLTSARRLEAPLNPISRYGKACRLNKKNCKSWREQVKVNCQELLKFGLTPTLLELRYHPLGRKKNKEGQAVRGLGGWT